ncbi:transmembrane anchor protein [Stenotrophomonas sp. GD04145]|uniref:transmembrane anchor protein n=1 Tax=Stenotrophomonas sp. GD04145 TaxID=2975436 RepID=UPI00244A7642|nr:transmembrane anchor protein [Stenotrophomonas sp. GD04145]MDH0170965.1 transmembrane anchor protein [Stenotrophomonas sp. GD04145]
MYNSKPLESDLPSSRQLARTTLIAAGIAVVLLIGVVLPAEHAVDPLGIGRMLGLTEMGQIKQQLSEEAAADAAMDARAEEGLAVLTQVSTRDRQTVEVTPKPAAASASAPAAMEWRDEAEVVLAPGQGTEIKLSMKEGERATYTWSVQGGVVNFDTHGDGGGRAISYEKGRGEASDQGVLLAAFTGNHGWFWRNRGEEPVTLLLRTGGQYEQLKKM